jgi:integrase/recombinase XerC
MFLSKRSNGIYYLWYKDGSGKKIKVSTGAKLKADAAAFLQEFIQKDTEHRKKQKDRPLSDFIQEFLAYSKQNYSAKTVRIFSSVLRRFQLFLGDCFLNSLTPKEADLYKVERLKSISATSVNIELRTLKSAFNTAHRWGNIVSNPFDKISFVKLPETQPMYFTKEDFQRLLNMITEQWLKEIVLLATLTGMRRGEIVNLRWQDVDLQRKVIQIQSNATFKTKQGKRRAIPMSEVAFHLLQSRFGKGTSEYVFSLTDQKISEGWLTHKFKYYVYEAKLNNDKLHFHSLRHTFASWLVQDGVSLYEVQKLLGHSNISVTQVYSHLEPEKLHNTVNKISLIVN